MILKLFSIYDSKVEAYLPPVYFKSKGEFLRAFAEACNDVKSNIGKYPADYTAFELGDWDDGTCSFKFHTAPISLGTAIEFKVVSQATYDRHVPPDGMPITS